MAFVGAEKFSKIYITLHYITLHYICQQRRQKEMASGYVASFRIETVAAQVLSVGIRWPYAPIALSEDYTLRSLRYVTYNPRCEHYFRKFNAINQVCVSTKVGVIIKLFGYRHSFPINGVWNRNSEPVIKQSLTKIRCLVLRVFEWLLMEAFTVILNQSSADVSLTPIDL